MMVAGKIVSAGGGDRLELMVGKGSPEVKSRGCQGIMEDVVGIVHPVDPKDRLEAALVEDAVVGYHRVSFQEGLDLLPYLREDGSVLRVFGSEAVHLPAEPLVVLGLRVDERIEGIHDDVVEDDDHADGAHAGSLLIRRLEVYAVEIPELTHSSSAWPRYHP